MNAPPRIKGREIERYWTAPPPEPSTRCLFWLWRICVGGWRTNRRIGSMGYYEAADFFGVYIWEYLNVIGPALRAVETR